MDAPFRANHAATARSRVVLYRRSRRTVKAPPFLAHARVGIEKVLERVDARLQTMPYVAGRNWLQLIALSSCAVG